MTTNKQPTEAFDKVFDHPFDLSTHTRTSSLQVGWCLDRNRADSHTTTHTHTHACVHLFKLLFTHHHVLLSALLWFWDLFYLLTDYRPKKYSHMKNPNNKTETISWMQTKWEHYLVKLGKTIQITFHTFGERKSFFFVHTKGSNSFVFHVKKCSI